MAIEKMKLVKISGSLTKLYDLSARLCESECFHPDSAAKYISCLLYTSDAADE